MGGGGEGGGEGGERLGGKTNTCFARSKSMDLNDFLIISNALSIQCDLVTQSHGDLFS